MTEFVHLYLVSSQVTPNITPAADPAIQPQLIVLLVSPQMKQRAAWLSAVLVKRGIRVEQWEISDAWDIEHIQSRVLALLEHKKNEVDKKTFVLNATGGTKAMSIAAFEVFRAFDLPIFYVHPEQDRLIWVHPQGRPALELADRVKLEPFLAAHGAQTEGPLHRDLADARLLELGEALLRDIKSLARALRSLNWLANTAQNSLKSKPLDKHQLADGELIDLIRRFERLNLVEKDNNRLVFTSEEDRFVVNGGWFEHYVFARIRALRSEGIAIQDIAQGVDLYRELQGEKVRNELDVAFLSNNRLHIVECKTRT